MSEYSQQLSAATQIIQAELQQSIEQYVGADCSLCVAFSGGLDSSVLLHALAQLGGVRAIRAVHIDHGLQPESSAWAATCGLICAASGVPYRALQVKVDLAAGKGLESAAREARYAAFASELNAGEILVSAHHRRDQLETVLLQLFRGAGVHGLAAMPRFAERSQLSLLRPLLDVSADDILAYGTEHDLSWIEDPSNSELDIDRNYLRHQVLPLLYERWTAVEATVERSARLCGEAAAMLDELAAQDLSGIHDNNRLRISGLLRLSPPRQRNALRFALRANDLPVPSEKQLRGALALFTDARQDSQPEYSWPGVVLRRYRDSLWLFSATSDPGAARPGAGELSWNPELELDLGPVRGKLQAMPVVGCGIARHYLSEGCSIRFRQGGEKLRPGSGNPTRELKNLLQETDIVPWMRGHIPLIYAGDDLLAVAGLWINQEFAAGSNEPGLDIKWTCHSDIREADAL